MSETVKMTVTMTVPVAWVQWGRGTFHLQVAGAGKTVCGRDIPKEGVRTTRYSHSKCALCRRRATDEQLEAAEAARREIGARHRALAQTRVDRNRAGVFDVIRCKLCGRQVHNYTAERGVPYCMEGRHVAELEQVEARGPVWTPTKDAA